MRRARAARTVPAAFALSEQSDVNGARNDWKVLKNRLKKEGSQVVANCNRLKLTARDGKKYLTDVADAETMAGDDHPAGAYASRGQAALSQGAWRRSCPQAGAG